MGKIIFFYKPYEVRRYWSQKWQDYYTSYNIEDQIWDTPTLQCKGYMKELKDILPILPVNATKATRSCVLRFATDRYPLRDKTLFKLWNGIIALDLDLYHSTLVMAPGFDNVYFYNVLKDALYSIFPNNVYYIEHSSSGIGVHIFLYFNVERTEENFHKCAKFTKYKLFKECDRFWPGLSGILSEKGVFDAVYDRPFQKVYLTGIDAETNFYIDGSVDFDGFEIEQKEKVKDTASYDIVKHDFAGRTWAPDYQERLRIYTALKRVTANQDMCEAYWRDLCRHFENNKYSYDTLCRQFSYNSIKEEEARVDILEKYGIFIEKGSIYHHLSEKRYLSDVLPQILDETDNGVNLLKAGTGVGKTQAWISLNDSILDDPMRCGTEKPILIIEPLNSIIDTKYDEKVTIVNKSMKFPNDLTRYGMYVTNYNKLLTRYDGAWHIKEDAADFLSRFQLVVIDESHIIIKDSFRCDVLIPFIETINKAGEKTKIIMQTATPMDEEKLFKIKNFITVDKPVDKDIKFIFRNFQNKEKKFSIQEVTCLARYYINAGRKVYIYWNDASLQKLNSFKYTYFEPDKVAIVHKRNQGDDTMDYIMKEHRLGDKYDIILTSVYFGVGNDLNDEQDTAVIIIGNNTWQEDVQAIGRWRNSRNIEVCEIILPDEYEFIESTAATVHKREWYLAEERERLEKKWYDKINKDKSVIIGKQTYQMRKEADIETLAIIKSSENYYSSFKVKTESLSDEFYGIRVKPDYTRPLECNEDYTEKVKEYNRTVQDIRNDFIKDIVTGKYDDMDENCKNEFYARLNKDTKVERWYKLWNQLKTYHIEDVIPFGFVTMISHYNVLKCWLDYYRALAAREIDYPEIYSLLWYRDMTVNKVEKEYVIDGVELKQDEYYTVLAYVLYIIYKNKEDKDYRILYDYFNTFKWHCKLFKEMPDGLIRMLYNTGGTSDLKHSIDFFKDQGLDYKGMEVVLIESIKDVMEQTEKMEKTEEEICRIVKRCMKYYTRNYAVKEQMKDVEDVSEKRSIAAAKPVIITKKFNEKKLKKYKISVGKTFRSQADLAQKIGVKPDTVSRWRTKGWIDDHNDMIFNQLE